MKIKATYSSKLSEHELVKDVKNKAYSITFKISGRNNLGCIDIGVYNQRARNNVTVVDYAIINSINSDTSCSIAGNLELGIGTRDMIYTSLQTVLKLCPWVKYFKFNDYSKKNVVIATVAVYHYLIITLLYMAKLGMKKFYTLNQKIYITEQNIMNISKG
jgi:hypothetical protein